MCKDHIKQDLAASLEAHKYIAHLLWKNSCFLKNETNVSYPRGHWVVLSGESE